MRYFPLPEDGPSETQYYTDRQWTKSKERSLQLDSILVFIYKYISAKKHISRVVVTMHVCTYIFVITCIQHAKQPLRIPTPKIPTLFLTHQSPMTI